MRRICNLDLNRTHCFDAVMATYDYPIAVIGAGAGGLVVAIGAAKAGRKVLLIERGTWGGDCTNTGCIPSKSLIASAHCAHALRSASKWGIDTELSAIDGSAAFSRVRDIVAAFVEEEDPKALREHGVDTLTGTARFLDAHTLDVDGKRITAEQIVVATGSHPVVPPIEGIEETPYHTNESIFSLERAPERLAVIGGGAIGCELAQAFQRLGSQVVLVEYFDHLLFREEPESYELIEKTLSEEGILLQLGHTLEAVAKEHGDTCLRIKNKETGTEEILRVDEVLICTGRAANVGGLGLEALGIQVEKGGVRVDRYGRTSVKNIWVVGDASGGPQFTHWAEMEGRAVLTSLLLPGPLKSAMSSQSVPAVTYCDPELARVGLTEREAVEKFGEKKLAIYFMPFSSIDRAIASGRTDGFVKVITRKWSSKIVGATVVGERAGEMLAELSLAMKHGIPLRKIASLVHPYPTYNHAIRKAADLWLSQTVLPGLKSLFGKRT
jgi:pyruvate/2-oxoglutarate dehydrogenase complex dihydrolipoamide dehydrogenase (E3) component